MSALSDTKLDLLMDDVVSESQKLKKSKQPKPKKEITDMDKQEFNKAKAVHGAEISKYRRSIFDSHVRVWSTIFGEVGTRHRAKVSIRQHKLLKKQAKITYKLSKSEES